MDTSAGYVGTASTLQEIAPSAARLLQESRPELHACELPESTQVPSTSTLARRDGPFGRGAEEKKTGRSTTNLHSFDPIFDGTLD